MEKPEERGTYEEQAQNVGVACREIIELVKRGTQVIVTHGNGPQIGNLALQQEKARGDLPVQPLHVLGAMTQGQIGYMIQQTLQNLLSREKINEPVVSLTTQVFVDKNDVAFKNPSKPIGPFYDAETSDRLKLERNYAIKKVRPEGVRVYRRVVASPDPIRVIESKVVNGLIDSGTIVIASGGGGIPVVLNETGELEGVDAVVDKDLAAERLAEAVGADTLLILTNVGEVSLNFARPNEKRIERMSSSEAKSYMEQGQFLSGSMKPKVLACIRFVEWGGKRAIITALGKAVEAVEGRGGTVIMRE